MVYYYPFVGKPRQAAAENKSVIHFGLGSRKQTPARLKLNYVVSGFLNDLKAYPRVKSIRRDRNRKSLWLYYR